MGGGSYEFNTYKSEITVSQAGTAITGANYTGNLYGALVDTAAKEVMYTVTHTNVGIMTFRVGSNNQTTGQSTRYASLYYKKFVYQHYPLAISGLMSFDAVAVNNKVKLGWELAADKYSKVVLEKAIRLLISLKYTRQTAVHLPAQVIQMLMYRVDRFFIVSVPLTWKVKQNTAASSLLK